MRYDENFSIGEADEVIEVAVPFAPAKAAPQFAQAVQSPAEIPAEPEEVFPSELKPSLEMLKAADNQNPLRDRASEYRRIRRLKRLRKHVFDLQQGDVASVVDADAQAAIRNGTAQTIINKETRLKKLTARYN
jgi:hypothetical protein